MTILLRNSQVGMQVPAIPCESSWH